ncbi:hypothetical protein DL766_004091 [Monosporascus sp. MC13-8B]|uniref:Transcription factor domain-containing protein n=1 Tax=Monosporascus cannonballus TaxID=155416 RepID=A0ABY0HJP9_9PEZI|nr:hypothetical protein DL762_000784 [Monosporascus cannonballus]RYO96397.1 hypothetical protein DL763_003253 [Monosporascus cannonballus]RYP32084.1 hypothetical protein DL766_004091 [Monosporascus sp. MC13-8B]
MPSLQSEEGQGSHVSNDINSPVQNAAGSQVDHPVPSQPAQAAAGLGDGHGWITALDLELLHHYTISTCFTLSTQQMTRDFWRVNLPHMGFSHPYILRGILSLAALHLARSRASQRGKLIEQAIIHHNASVSLALPLITNMEPEIALSLSFFSVLTFYIAFAMPKQPNIFIVGTDGVIPEWFLLFRGMLCIREANRFALEGSSLSMMYHGGKLMNEVWESRSAEHDGLRELECKIRSHVYEQQKAAILLRASDALKRSFQFFRDPGEDDENKVRSVSIWLFKIEDDFVALLRQGDREALCVLAFFAVLLERLDNKWWMNGWGIHLIERIYSVLDEGYRLWIRWAMEEIGWSP